MGTCCCPCDIFFTYIHSFPDVSLARSVLIFLQNLGVQRRAALVGKQREVLVPMPRASCAAGVRKQGCCCADRVRLLWVRYPHRAEMKSYRDLLLGRAGDAPQGELRAHTRLSMGIYSHDRLEKYSLMFPRAVQWRGRRVGGR